MFYYAMNTEGMVLCSGIKRDPMIPYWDTPDAEGMLLWNDLEVAKRDFLFDDKFPPIKGVIFLNYLD